MQISNSNASLQTELAILSCSIDRLFPIKWRRWRSRVVCSWSTRPRDFTISCVVRRGADSSDQRQHQCDSRPRPPPSLSAPPSLMISTPSYSLHFDLFGITEGLCDGGCAAIVDSGTSLCTGPTTVMTQIIHAIGKEGVVSVEYWFVLFQRSSVSSHIVMAVGKESTESVGEDALCTACEMVVVWMKSQLNNEGVKDKVVEYVNLICDRIPSRGGSIY
ncbi:phytepsin [Salvia divinorum]|uniref:Phytepsin n=1 Tax=Salvia divinorum TaxID=28513 RepID=A0ABD1H6I2_SALDI